VQSPFLAGPALTLADAALWASLHTLFASQAAPQGHVPLQEWARFAHLSLHLAYHTVLCCVPVLSGHECTLGASWVLPWFTLGVPWFILGVPPAWLQIAGEKEAFRAALARRPWGPLTERPLPRQRLPRGRLPGAL